MPRARRPVAQLPHALDAGGQLLRRLVQGRPAVFLDYDGTLTPIVDRPQDAALSEQMRDTVRALANRCPVCVVTGRDRRVVQRLMGLDDLIVAGSHGFDIWSPEPGPVRRQVGVEHHGVLEEVRGRLDEALASVPGALVEPKLGSLAVHFRLVAEEERPRVGQLVQEALRGHMGELKVTPGKLVYEIQPRVDWNKGKAVLHLLAALGLDDGRAVPVYLGDDVTDEDAFEALPAGGAGILVRAGAGEVPARTTFADYVLDDVTQVQRFLAQLTALLGPPRPPISTEPNPQA